MPFSMHPLTLLALAAAAAAQPARRFVCPPQVQDFCQASNVHSYCDSGEFKSNAMDTCRRCVC